MKLADDVLLSIIEAFRKAIEDETDISELLRKLDLAPNTDGKLGLTVQVQDVWRD